MAQLKDTVVAGSLRITDELLTNSAQFKVLKIPTASNGTTYGVGTNGQVLKSNGTSVYWASDSNDHYTTHLYAGSGTAANAATTNGNTKITVTDNTTVRNSVTIKGTGATSVTSDANGVITINSTDNNTTYAFTDKNATLAWNTTSTIATVGGTNIRVTMPANPNTNTTYSFTNSAPTLAWNTTSTIGTVGGVALTVKMPANPNTNTTYAFVNSAPTLAWNTTSTVGTVGGVALTVKMPANPNTNTTYAFTNSAPTLAWNTTSTVGVVGGVALTVKMPANPDTNTTYSSKAAASGGTAVSLVTTGEKYTWNNKAGKSSALSLTLDSGSWSSGTPPTQTLTSTEGVSGVTASNNIIVGLANTATSAQINATAAGKILCTAQGTNSLEFTCYGNKPAENIPISVVILG